MQKDGVGERYGEGSPSECPASPQVHDDMSSVVVAQLLYLESQSMEKPIYMYINSPGGVVTAGLAIYDTMQFVKPPVCGAALPRPTYPPTHRRLAACHLALGRCRPSA